jgi:hypothetical protein
MATWRLPLRLNSAAIAAIAAKSAFEARLTHRPAGSPTPTVGSTVGATSDVFPTDQVSVSTASA